MFSYQNFRRFALLEGISFLLILFITMPLKYFYNMPQPNKWIGTIHGFLFIGYLIWVFMIKDERKWTTKQTFLAVLASILPFGTFWADKKIY